MKRACRCHAHYENMLHPGRAKQWGLKSQTSHHLCGHLFTVLKEYDTITICNTCSTRVLREGKCMMSDLTMSGTWNLWITSLFFLSSNGHKIQDINFSQNTKIWIISYQHFPWEAGNTILAEKKSKLYISTGSKQIGQFSVTGPLDELRLFTCHKFQKFYNLLLGLYLFACMYIAFPHSIPHTLLLPWMLGEN